MDVFCHGEHGIIEGTAPKYELASDICSERTVETIRRETACANGVLALAGRSADNLLGKI